MEKQAGECVRHGPQPLIGNFEVATGEVSAPTVQLTRDAGDVARHIEQTIATDPAGGWVFVADTRTTHGSVTLVLVVVGLCAVPAESFGTTGMSGVLRSVGPRKPFVMDPSHRVRLVYVPKHTSWLNQVAIWFSVLARRVIRRGRFRSTDELCDRILRFFDDFNETMAKPYKWTSAGRPLDVRTWRIRPAASARVNQADRVPVQAAQLPVDCRPVAPALGPRPPFRPFAEQVRPTPLVQPPDRVGHRPEVGHHDAGAFRHEDPAPGRVAAGPVEQAESRVVPAEAPQPPRLALDPPPGLVGAQDAGVRAVAVDLLVPRSEHVGLPVQRLDQAAGRQFQLQVLVEAVHDLAEGDGQAVIQPGGQGLRPVAESALREGVRDRRSYLLPATRVPVPVDRVPAGLGRQVVGQVLDDPGAGPAGPVQRAAAVRAGRELMRLVPVDAGRLGAGVARGPGLAAARLPPPAGQWLGVRRAGPGRGARPAGGGTDGRAELQEEEYEVGSVPGRDGCLGLVGRPGPGPEGRDEGRIEIRGHRGHGRSDYQTRPGSRKTSSEG